MMQIPEVNAFNSQYLNKMLQDKQYPVDRLWNDELALPYRFDQIKIKPNDHADATSFNLSMSRLYDNFLYLVSESQMSPPLDVEYYERLNLATELPINEQDLFPGDEVQIIDHVAAVTESGVKFSVSIIEDPGTRQRSIRMCSDKIPDPANPGRYREFVSSYVDNSKTRQFKQPIRLCLDNSNHVYVLDAGDIENTASDSDGPVVYRYNLIGILQNDPVMNAKEHTPGRELTHYVGGVQGTLTDKDRFNRPECIICDGENIYVADTDYTTDNMERVTIKKYDSRMNWSQSYNLLNIDNRQGNNITQTSQLKDMIEYNGKYLFVSGNHIVEYDASFSFLRSVHVGVEDPDNKPMYLHASDVNPNVLYLVRAFTIDKIYYTRLGVSGTKYIIRTYNIYNPPARNQDWIKPNIKYNVIQSAYERNQGRRRVKVYAPVQYHGNVMIFNYSNSAETELFNTYVQQNDADVIAVKTWKFTGTRPMYFWADNEIDLRQSILHDVFDKQIYTLEDTQVGVNEHANYFVYNKSISKMLHNMQIFIECVKGSFAVRGEWKRPVVDDQGETIEISMPATFQGVYYSVKNNLFRDGYQVTLDNFVHINEPFVTGVFNRALYELYKLQLELLDMSEIKWIHESNVFELADILASPCPDGLQTDNTRPFVDEDGVCLVPDDPTDEQDLCTMFAIKSDNHGTLLDSQGNCIIYGTNS